VREEYAGAVGLAKGTIPDYTLFKSLGTHIDSKGLRLKPSIILLTVQLTHSNFFGISPL